MLKIEDGTPMAAAYRALHGDPQPAQPRESASYKAAVAALHGKPGNG